MENQESSTKMPNGYSMAIISFILGLIGILTLLFCVGIVFSVVALVLGYLSLKYYHTSVEKTGRNYALAGVILSIIGIFLFILLAGGYLFIQYVCSRDGFIRSKTSRVKADHRKIAVALEAYFVDNNTYPKPDYDTKGRPVTPVILTTPIGYMDYLPKDIYSQNSKELYVYGGGDLKGEDPRYHWFKDGWIVASYGPDHVSGNSANAKGATLDPFKAWSNDLLGYKLEASDLTYDPTNGLKSTGDIWRRGP